MINKKYNLLLVAIASVFVFTLIDRHLGFKSIQISVFQIEQMLLVIPPVFVLLGLLDVWVPRDTMIKYMGEKSGIKGIILAILLGSATAGPLYGAFPVAAIFIKKGVKFSNVIIFIGAWSTTKIPMFLFEMSSLGINFALTRLLISIPGIILIAHVISKSMPNDLIEGIYAKMTEQFIDN